MVYYTETDCYWLDQIFRFWTAFVIIFYGIIYFYFQFQGGQYATPDDMTRVPFEAEAANFGDITYTFFFLMMVALAVNYWGLFYVFPYFVRP